MKKFSFTLLVLIFTNSILFADQYPNTSIGIIDINKVLTESKAAIDATKQIEKIQKKSEEESKNADSLIFMYSNLGTNRTK